MNLKLKILFCALFFMPCAFLYAQDPLGPRLRVDEEIEIGEDRSLRLKPVVGTMPASAERGDLFFNSGTLYTCPLDTCDEMTDWQVVTEKGDLFYDDTTSSLYYRDDTAWRRLGGKGPKTVASRIVAASNSDLSNKTADYICDGIDDQQEINRAINNLGTVGGAVYLLEGTYNISDALLEGETITGVVPHTGTAIIGTGAGTILQIVSGASNVNVINAQNVSRILISQLCVDGNNMTGSNNTGIYFSNVTSSQINKVWVENMTYTGIRLAASSKQNILCDNHVRSNAGHGIDLALSSNNIVSGNNVRENGTKPDENLNGIRVYPNSNNNILSSNNVQNNNDWGIVISQSSNNLIFGNNIQDNGVDGIMLDAYGNSTIISGNNVQGNQRANILLAASNNNLISGNAVLRSQQASNIGLEGGVGCSNNLIYGNTIFNEGGTPNFVYGIRFNDNADLNLISSNFILNNVSGTYGIGINSAEADNNYLVGNQIILQVGAGKVNDQGTSTTYTDKLKMTLEKRTVTSGFSPLDVATNPRTYVALNPSGAITLTLSNGKAAGDLLILENVSNKLITINDAGNINLVESIDGPTCNEGGSRSCLCQYDTLELIWNGSKWIEVKYVDN